MSDVKTEAIDKIFQVTVETVNKVIETREDFIFTTITNWFVNETITNSDTSKIPVSKRLLIRALSCFQQEHPEEYNTLLNESHKRMEEIE